MEHIHIYICIYMCVYDPISPIGLAHWGRATHIRVSKWATIGSDNGLASGRRQAIIWINDKILPENDFRIYFHLYLWFDSKGPKWNMWTNKLYFCGDVRGCCTFFCNRINSANSSTHTYVIRAGGYLVKSKLNFMLVNKASDWLVASLPAKQMPGLKCLSANMDFNMGIS